MTYTLHLGDCLEFMRGLPDGCIDAVITDPPYGVSFDYGGAYSDSPDGYRDWIATCFAEMRRVASVVIVTPGISNLFFYPPPLWTCGWFKPGSPRRNITGGFNEWEPILIYADKLKIQNDSIRIPFISNIDHDRKNTHPCPKPVVLLKYLVKLGTKQGATVFDPFAGSGTTGVAAMQLGRRFIGCEIDPTYHAIATRRIEAAAAQGIFDLSGGGD